MPPGIISKTELKRALEETRIDPAQIFSVTSDCGGADKKLAKLITAESLRRKKLMIRINCNAHKLDNDVKAIHVLQSRVINLVMTIISMLYTRANIIIVKKVVNQLGLKPLPAFGGKIVTTRWVYCFPFVRINMEYFRL